MDNIKVMIKAEVENIEEVVKQVEELEERLSRLRVNLIVNEPGVNNDTIGSEEVERLSIEKDCKVEVSVLIFAMRYALRKETQAPSIVVDNIKHNVLDISNKHIQLIIEDIEGYEKEFGFEKDCDKDLWLGFRDYLRSVLFDRCFE